MANDVQPDGRRVFDDAYGFPQDSQDLADDLWDAWVTRVGTSVERQSMPPGLRRAGLGFRETDTGITWVDDGSTWTPVSGLPYGAVWRSANQTVPDNGTNVALTYDSAAKVRGGMSFDANGFTAPIAGVYRIMVLVNYSTSNTGRRDAAFAINGVIQEQYRYIGVASASVAFLASVEVEVPLAAGDVVTAFGRQTSGADRTVTGMMSVEMKMA